MMRRFVLTTGLLLAVLASSASACSQCMCGTPISPDVLGEQVPTRVRFGFEERYLSKSNGLDEGPGSEREREHRVSAFGVWRAGARLALLGRLPYNEKEIATTPEGEATTTDRSHGIGDAEMVGLVALTDPHRSGPLQLGALVSVTAPTGSNDVADRSGERLDAHLQPGSGAWSGALGANLVAARAFGTLDASVIARTSGRNAHGYRYGNAWLFNVGWTSVASHGWQLLAGVNGRAADRDRFEDATLGANTGGSVVYLAPGLRVRAANGLGLESVLQIPVAASLNGDQTEHTTARLALSVGR